MDKTDAELNLENKLKTIKITIKEHLINDLLEVFEEVCGDWGKQEFEGMALPAIFNQFGNNYNIAGIEALSLIEFVSDNTQTDNIGDYLRTWASNKICEDYSTSTKNRLKEIQETIIEYNIRNEGEYSRLDRQKLELHIGHYLRMLIQDRGLNRGEIAQEIYTKMSYSGPSGAMRLISDICNGTLTPGSERVGNIEKRLARLGTFISFLEIDENHISIQGIRSLYVNFQYTSTPVK